MCVVVHHTLVVHSHTCLCATVSVHLASYLGGSSLVFFLVNDTEACNVLQTSSWTQPGLNLFCLVILHLTYFSYFHIFVKNNLNPMIASIIVV